MTNSGAKLFTRAATAASSGESAPKSPMMAKRRGRSEGFCGSRPARLHPANRRTRTARLTRPNSPLFSEQITERAELGGFGHARAVFLVGSFFGVFFERA